MEAECKRIGKACTKYIYEESPRVKVYCGPDKYGRQYREKTSVNVRHTFNVDGVLYSPPMIMINTASDGNYVESTGVGDDLEEGLFIHGLMHALGHSHMGVKWIPSLNNGKGAYRCDWTIEPDYTYLCSPKGEKSDCRAGSENGIHCGMKPTSHIDPETGDLTKDYMETIEYINMYKKRKPFQVVDDPARCFIR